MYLLRLIHHRKGYVCYLSRTPSKHVDPIVAKAPVLDHKDQQIAELRWKLDEMKKIAMEFKYVAVLFRDAVAATVKEWENSDLGEWSEDSVFLLDYWKTKEIVFEDKGLSEASKLLSMNKRAFSKLMPE